MADKLGYARVQDSFVLCRIFRKSALGLPNGDRYAPFIEEEWDADTAVVPGVEADDDVAIRDEARVEGNDLDQDAPPKTPHPDEDPELISLSQSKRPKHNDSSSSHANGSEDSITSHAPPTMMTMTNCSPTLLGVPLLESIEPRESQTCDPPTSDPSNLEKSVPPEYLKYISNLEKGMLNVSKEREMLKLEVMRAQAMINVLQSRIEFLNKENEDMRRVIRGD